MPYNLCDHRELVGDCPICDLEAENDALKAKLEEAEKALVLIGEKAVVDWDNETVGQVDAVVKNGGKYKDWLKAIFKLRVALEEILKAMGCTPAMKHRRGECMWCDAEYALLQYSLTYTVTEDDREIAQELMTTRETMKPKKGGRVWGAQAHSGCLSGNCRACDEEMREYTQEGAE